MSGPLSHVRVARFPISTVRYRLPTFVIEVHATKDNRRIAMDRSKCKSAVVSPSIWCAETVSVNSIAPFTFAYVFHVSFRWKSIPTENDYLNVGRRMHVHCKHRDALSESLKSGRLNLSIVRRRRRWFIIDPLLSHRGFLYEGRNRLNVHVARTTYLGGIHKTRDAYKRDCLV